MKSPRFSMAMIIVLSIILSNGIYAQIKEKIPPKSTMLQLQNDDIISLNVTPLNFDRIAEEDRQNKSSTRDLRIAVPRQTNINMNSHGSWQKLENGRLWRFKIESTNALATILEYDLFHLPIGATLHLYNQDRSHLVGAYTARNNKGSLKMPGTFLTELIHGSSITLEYFEPNAVEHPGIISISRVLLAYRDVNQVKRYKGFNDSGACQVNINCPDGNPWQTNKRGVSRMLITFSDGAGFCTGQLLTATEGGLFKPYYLTANHCIDDTYDATGTNNVTAIFYWDYEASGCSNPSTEPASITSSGAMVVANKADSDFALFWLLEDPFRDAGYNPTYLGWSATTSPGAGGACIHHPAGDIKKISLFSQTPGSNAFCDPDLTWNVVFNHGGGQYSSTEGGSSGSALFDNNGRVIGQLWGGTDLGPILCSAGPECADPEDDRSYYGKFSDSWDDGSGKRRRLKDWLDTPCSINSTHSVNVTNTAEMFFADNAVTSSAGIYDNSSTKATVVNLDGGNRVDLTNGFEVDGSANVYIRNESDCPAGRQAAPDGVMTADAIETKGIYTITNETTEQ